MSWSTVVTLSTVTFVTSAVVFGVLFLLALNPELCRRLIRSIRRQPYYPEMAEFRLYDEALRLRTAVDAALRSAPVSATERRVLRNQANEVPSHVATVLTRLHLVRKLRKSLDGTTGVDIYGDQDCELAALEQELLSDLRCSVDALGSLPVSLLNVEMRRDEYRVKRVMSDAADANNRMRDRAAAWKELS